MTNRADSDQSTLVGEEKQAVESPPSVAARAEPSAPDLEDTSLYFNRELSWLDFNDRVLQLAEDPSVPLLERVKFCAIYQDNLDEFFMVRVANLHDQIEAGRDARGADGMSAREQIDAIHARVPDSGAACALLRGRPSSHSRRARDPADLRSRPPTTPSAPSSTTCSSARSSRR